MIATHSQKNNYFLILSAIPLMIILFLNLYRFYLSCTSAIDYSIYQEAILKLSNFKSLNPFINIRGVHIFADHLDPIIILTTPLMWLTGNAKWAPILIEWLWTFSALILLLTFYYKNLLTKNAFIYFILAISFTKAILSGLQFSVHPTSWMLLFSIMLFYYLTLRKYKASLFFAFSLLLFRESIVFSLLGLSMALFIIDHKKKPALTLFIVNLIYYWIAFKYRPTLFETYIDYSDGVLSGLLASPVSFFLSRVANLELLTLIKFFYPFIIPIIIYFFIEKTSKPRFRPYIILLFYLAPMLVLHVLTDKFRYHYGAQMVGPILGVLIADKNFHTIFEKKFILIICSFLCLGNGISHYTKPFKYFFLHQEPNCYTHHDKLPYVNEIIAQVKNTPSDSKILTTGGIIPQIMDAERSFFHFEGYSLKQPLYDYIIIEKNKVGDTYPIYDIGQLNATIEKCQKNAILELINNKFFYMAKGLFKYDCN